MDSGLVARKRQLSWGRRFHSAFLAIGLSLVSCGRLETRGGLMLMISHDGTLTEMDELRLAVESSDGSTLLSRTYVVPDELGLPATLGIISNGKADATVTINVSGWANGEPKDLRTAIVAQVPVRETVALPIVLAEKCEELVEEEEGEAVSKCGEEGTCNPETAECQSAKVDASELPEYEEGDEEDIGDPNNSSGGSGSGGAASGGDGSGGATSGGSGSGGASQGAPCTQEGQYKCGMLPGPERLICTSGTFQPAAPCEVPQLCASSNGSCLNPLSECAGREEGSIHCSPEGDLMRCNADLVSSTLEENCSLGCTGSPGNAECSSTTTQECGDGMVQNYPSEMCDDNNTSDGDGCSGTCKPEAQQIVTGVNHTCIMTLLGIVKCFGSNEYGQLGKNVMEGTQTFTGDYGDSASEMGSGLAQVDFGPGKNAIQITAGDYHTCALLNDQTVKCWGKNSEGQLGLGDPMHRGDQTGEMGSANVGVNLGTSVTAKAVEAGGNHTCAILNNDKLKCWGQNNFAQLGLGDGTNANQGIAGGEMGNGLPEVPLGTGKTVKQVSAGGNHTCVVLNDNTVKCWGRNDLGQLGRADDATLPIGYVATEMGDNLPIVNLGTGRTAKSISVGLEFTCAVLNNDHLKCWGINGYGQLGRENNTIYGGSTGQMGDDLVNVPLGSTKTAKAVSAGSYHTCVILNDDSLKCFGRFDSGQLGLGPLADNVGDEANEMGDSLPTVSLGTSRSSRSVAAYVDHTCAILDNNAAKCWGYGFDGRLGQGSQTQIGLAAADMGDTLAPILLF